MYFDTSLPITAFVKREEFDRQWEIHMSSTDKIKPCPECGGQRVKVSSFEFGYIKGALWLVQGRRKTGFFYTRSNESLANTLTCLKCGYTAWYAQSPENLIPDE